MNRSISFLIPGAIFGAGLAIAGMTNPAKVIGFLDLTGAWDPSLALVMVGAILVHGIGVHIVARRKAPVMGGAFPKGSVGKPDLRLVVGAGLFGVGWGLAGFCPGPAIANLGGLHAEVLLFVFAMLAGMIVAQRGFGADR